jgi:predicted house-cleaning noncanonical NTP pyrophosphatase (MazG superfamily)
MQDRKIIDVRIQTGYNFYNILDGKTFEEVKLVMDELKEIFIDSDIYFSVHCDYDYTNLDLIERRLENDEEYNRRLDREKNERLEAKVKEAQERKLYEQLKKKFEG